jgi:multiple sugar transport system permease protein
MIIVHDWGSIPFFMLIWLAGLSGIPQELREAARVDGATRLQSFWHVELPLLRPTALFVAAITTINASGLYAPVGDDARLGRPRMWEYDALYIWQNGFAFHRMVSPRQRLLPRSA